MLSGGQLGISMPRYKDIPFKTSLISFKDFLPKQMSDEETQNICKKVIENLGAKSITDMGKVMGVLKKDYGDVLDFSKVSNLIKKFLK